jgi:hypothetical protein
MALRARLCGHCPKRDQERSEIERGERRHSSAQARPPEGKPGENREHDHDEDAQVGDGDADQRPRSLPILALTDSQLSASAPNAASAFSTASGFTDQP